MNLLNKFNAIEIAADTRIMNVASERTSDPALYNRGNKVEVATSKSAMPI